MRILGIDIGGTAIKWGIEENGDMVDTGTRPSFAKDGAARLLENLYDLADGLKFDMLGISTAGVVSSDGSILYANENIPGYTGVKLREILTERYRVPVGVLNDIAAAAYSEYNDSDYYYIALGTGVGGVYVKDGVVLSGATGVAGQIGYLPSRKGGTVDFDASSRGLCALCGGDAKALFERAEAGDAGAERILAQWCSEVANVIMHIIGFINPRSIIIGGGVSEQGDALLKRINKELEDLPVPYKNSSTLRVARGGNFAGVKGIIKYVREFAYE